MFDNICKDVKLYRGLYFSDIPINIFFKYQNLELIKWIYIKYPIQFNCLFDDYDGYSFEELVFKSNNIEIIEWMYDTFVYLRNIRISFNFELNINTILWIYNKQTFNFTSSHINIYAQNNNIEIVKFLHSHDINCNTYGANQAAKNNHIQMIKLLHSYDINCNTYGANLAAKNNHIQMIELLHSYIINCDINGANLAIDPNYLNEYNSFDDKVYNTNNLQKLQMIELLHNYGIVFNVITADLAAKTNNLELLQFLYNSCNILCSKDGIGYAEYYKYTQILEWFNSINLNYEDLM